MKRTKEAKDVKSTHLTKKHKPNRKQGFTQKMNVKMFMSGIF
jgi:hypothetical protein